MSAINPILSTTPASYLPAVSNLMPSSAISDDSDSDTTTAGGIDSRRYTQYDRTATEAGVASMSFDDFVDMVNPLQHIPVISSVYRAVENQNINPVSRIVGDMMYSGPLGAISAAMSGIGAIANSVMESQSGSDSTKTVFAALFGKDDETSSTAPIQIAANDTAATEATKTQQAPLSLLAAATPDTAPNQTSDSTTGTIFAALFGGDDDQISSPTSMQMAANDPAVTEAAKAQQVPAPMIAAATLPVTMVKAVPQQNAPALPSKIEKDEASDSDTSVASANTSLTGNAATKLLPLDRTRMNANSLANAANSIENQNRVIALSEGSHGMRLGHMIYTNSLMNGPKPMPSHVTPSSTDAAASSTGKADTAIQSMPSSNPQATSTPTSTDTAMPALTQTTAQNSVLSTQSNAMPPALFDDVMILKRLNQYKSFATAPTTNGATLDITN